MLKKDVTIICVLRRSTVFGIDYVERLKHQLDTYAPGVRFACISNVAVPCERIPITKGWPGWWSKMELFRPDIKGDLFFLDLDTIVCGPIWDLLNVNQLTMLSDFFVPARPASGLMYLPEERRTEIWNTFCRNSISFMHKYKKGGDQAFLHMCYGNKPARWQELFPGRVISYKAQKVFRDGVPTGTGILCFHGRPKPRDIQWKVSGLKPLPSVPTRSPL